MAPSSRSIALSVGALSSLLAASPSNASGLARIRQNDGATTSYRAASIRADGPRELRIGSPDRRDVLIVASSGCTLVAGLEACRPTSVRLLRSGRTYPLALRAGSELFNVSATPRSAADAATSVPGHGIVLHLITAKGTTIDVRGTIDGGVRA